MTEEKLWTTQELADEATRRGKPISRETVRAMCTDGRLVADKPGRDWLIPDWQAQLWLAQWLSSV